MKLPIQSGSIVSDFAVRCLTNDHFPNETAQFEKYWMQANNEQEFVDLIIDDKNLIYSQSYGVLAKSLSEERYAKILMDYLWENTTYYETMSDIGSVRFQSLDGSFAVTVPNEVGDGMTQVFIADDTESASMKFNTNLLPSCMKCCLHGKFTMQDYDCGGESICHLEGNYFAYGFSVNYYGIVVLQKYS